MAEVSGKPRVPFGTNLIVPVVDPTRPIGDRFVTISVAELASAVAAAQIDNEVSDLQQAIVGTLPAITFSNADPRVSAGAANGSAVPGTLSAIPAECARTHAGDERLVLSADRLGVVLGLSSRSPGTAAAITITDVHPDGRTAQIVVGVSIDAAAAPPPSPPPSTLPAGAASFLITSVPYFVGVNYGGGGGGSLPGYEEGTSHRHPTNANIDYYLTKGLGNPRLTYKLERVQRTPYGPLEQVEVGHLRRVINRHNAASKTVLLSMHNYMRIRLASENYEERVMGRSTWGGFPIAAVEDVYYKLGLEFKDANIIWGIMNEPFNMRFPENGGQQNNVDIQNSAMAALRRAGCRQPCLASGDNYSGGHSWNTYDENRNSLWMLQIEDPGFNNYGFDVHNYLDSDRSGSKYTNQCVLGAGSNDLVFINGWAVEHGKKLLLGETAGCWSYPSDSRYNGENGPGTCLKEANDMLNFVKTRRQAVGGPWIGWTWWQGSTGREFTEMHNVNPDGFEYNDRPIVDKGWMATLEAHKSA